MNLNQGALAQTLVDKLLEIIHEYDETIYFPTVSGCLELVKRQLLDDSIELVKRQLIDDSMEDET